MATPWVSFVKRVFRHCDGSHPVQWRAFPNPGETGRAATLSSRKPGEIEAFHKRFDRSGYGVYFGVCTRRRGAPHGDKANLIEAPAAWVDIDTEAHGIDTAKAIDAQQRCPCPPSIIVNSGRGLHCYWTFTEPLCVDVERDSEQERLERLNRRLAGVFAGDFKAYDSARVLRVPGTKNTKDGGDRLVTVLHQSDADYDITDLEDWLADQRPLIDAPDMPATVTEIDDANPWRRYAGEHEFGTTVDVDAELAAMTDGTIHHAQLRVVASLLHHGWPIDETVGRVLDATNPAAAAWEKRTGRRWDWAEERRRVEGMARSFVTGERPGVLGAKAYAKAVKAREQRAKQAGTGTPNEESEPDATAAAAGANNVVPLKRPKNWQDQLHKKKNGALYENVPNAVAIIDNATDLSARLRLNEMTEGVELSDGDRWRPWRDEDESNLRHRLQRQGMPMVAKQTLADAVSVVADRNRVDPLRDYFEGLEWDGVARIETLLIDHAGAADEPYVRECTKRWFISGAARALTPGCQADHMLVLEGPQGCRKTSFARLLGVMQRMVRRGPAGRS